jgi:hypothetical protein
MAPVQIKVAANDFLDFVNASPTPFHAVKSVKDRLTSVGFKQINVSQLGHVAPLQAPAHVILGENLVVLNPRSRRQILPHSKWINHRRICHRQEMEAR